MPRKGAIESVSFMHSRFTMSRFFMFMALLFLMPLAGGCNPSTRPPLGRVQGKVTLDGKPLAGAAVAFLPDGPGRESTAFTDEDGDYTLIYIRDIEGASVGWHRVRVSTGDPRTGTPELVPKRFHANTELFTKVVAGDNEINFDLPSE